MLPVHFSLIPPVTHAPMCMNLRASKLLILPEWRSAWTACRTEIAPTMLATPPTMSCWAAALSELVILSCNQPCKMPGGLKRSGEPARLV